jgi:hypothetical protein
LKNCSGYVIFSEDQLPEGVFKTVPGEVANAATAGYSTEQLDLTLNINERNKNRKMRTCLFHSVSGLVYIGFCCEAEDHLSVLASKGEL